MCACVCVVCMLCVCVSQIEVRFIAGAPAVCSFHINYPSLLLLLLLLCAHVNNNLKINNYFLVFLFAHKYVNM